MKQKIGLCKRLGCTTIIIASLEAKCKTAAILVVKAQSSRTNNPVAEGQIITFVYLRKIKL